MSAPPVIRHAAPGWFGKLPGLGDFAGRRLPAAFVQRWDAWLQAALAQAARDPDWCERYLVAPIQRFWLAPGLLDALGWAGLLMPSVDRVGRHFPLTVAQPVPSLAHALAAAAWFDALDAATRRVLDLDFRVEDFEHALEALPPAAPGPDDAARRLADRVQADGSVASVWWLPGAVDAPALRGYPGLPPPAAAAALVGGLP